MIDPNTPVLIGAGQRTWRKEAPPLKTQASGSAMST
jgi:hypothetical protein